MLGQGRKMILVNVYIFGRKDPLPVYRGTFLIGYGPAAEGIVSGSFGCSGINRKKFFGESSPLKLR